MIGEALFVTIVIPTHNRIAMLRQTLDGLAAQTYPPDHIEVVVVADGCIDRTVETLSRYNAPFALRVLELQGEGAARARNAGAAAALHALLLFLDDDIEATPYLVEAHVRAHQGARGQVVIGYSPPVSVRPSGLFEITLRNSWEEMFQEMRKPGHRFTYRDLLSGNVSIDAELFARVGGFDTTFNATARDDFELGARLITMGASFAFAAHAVGYHHDNSDLDRACQRKLREGAADVLFGRRHPELRSTLPLANIGVRLSRLGSVLRTLAFYEPAAGDALAVLRLQTLLSVLERLRLRRYWRSILSLVLDYWYWRGVAEGVGTKRALTKLLQGEPAQAYKGPEIDIDLREGIEAAERRLDEERPHGVRIRFGILPIGRIPAQVGAERLRAAHLRPFLAKDVAWQLLAALAMDKATGGTATSIHETSLHEGSFPRQQPPGRSRSASTAIKVLEIELSKAIEPVQGISGYAALRILVRLQGRPIGWVWVDGLRNPVVSPERIYAAIADQLAWDLLPLTLLEGIGESGNECAVASPVSVVVCTRDRADQLHGCLQALLALDYPSFEVIVVDNASRTGDTAAIAAGFPVRYVREDRPGLDWARNRGIAEARHAIVAFTDDDARPDPGWLTALTRAFADAEVMAVTGLVAPAELDTEAQIRFELGYGGMGHGFQVRTINRATLTKPASLLWASSFGVGANMAFRRSVLDAVGPFDVALDVGTPSGGCGDVEMLHRIVARGYTIVYEPGALVWHMHRRDAAALRRLMYDNGRGFGSYLLTCARNRTLSRPAILGFAVRHWLGWWLIRRLLRPHGFPRHLVMFELAGALRSPKAYRAAQVLARHIARDGESNVRSRAVDHELPGPAEMDSALASGHHINETP
ncbi:MAG: glycosyltransferase, partial [Chloroflexi bacterium]|nr:glycosyltransferase [Chloroflexota bacterium]